MRYLATCHGYAIADPMTGYMADQFFENFMEFFDKYMKPNLIIAQFAQGSVEDAVATNFNEHIPKYFPKFEA